MQKKGNEPLRSVDKALQLLEAFSSDRPRMSAAELSEALSLPKVSVYRFLRALMKRGFVVQDTVTHAFGLGIKVFELGSIVIANMEIRRIAFPLLEKLSRSSGETVHLGVLDRHEVVSIEGAESDNHLRISLPVGKRVYLHSTGIGKAILAYLSEDLLDEIVTEQGLPSMTSETITERTELGEELKRIRERGFAVDNEENSYGIRCVAAPVRDHSGVVIASVSVSCPAVRLPADRIPVLAEMVIETSLSISERLGFSSAALRQPSSHEG